MSDKLNLVQTGTQPATANILDQFVAGLNGNAECTNTALASDPNLITKLRQALLSEMKTAGVAIPPGADDPEKGFPAALNSNAEFAQAGSRGHFFPC
ncbi:MAG TPA: hypothetical protein VHX12_08140 [Acidisoma sp.]|nr:hypothetical protein [Acidisoma sp.]